MMETIDNIIEKFHELIEKESQGTISPSELQELNILQLSMDYNDEWNWESAQPLYGRLPSEKSRYSKNN